jgi:ABC-type Fe3+-hydroxamate transport system substrate-binding protein
VKIRFLILSALISIGLLFAACVQSPEKAPRKATAAAEKKSADQKKTIRVKHLSGEVLSVNSKAKTIIVRFKDEDVELKYDDGTIVKVDLDSVRPAAIPLGSRATVKYVERKGQYVAKGIFISTETAEKKEGTPRSSYRNSA